MSLAIIISPITSLKTLPIRRALLDSEATGMFISQDFVQKHKLETYCLPHPIAVHNVNGSPNGHGSITEEVELILCYRDHSERAHLAVANIGQQSIIIGYAWLLHHNLEIDWKKNLLALSHCPTSNFVPDPDWTKTTALCTMDSRSWYHKQMNSQVTVVIQSQSSEQCV